MLLTLDEGFQHHCDGIVNVPAVHLEYVGQYGHMHIYMYVYVHIHIYVCVPMCMYVFIIYTCMYR